MRIKFLAISLLILVGACSSPQKGKEIKKENLEESVESNLGWEIGNNRDEWGDVKDGKNAFGAFMGTFSNSATSEGSVAVAMSVKTIVLGERLDTIVGFALGEYNARNSIKNMTLKGKARNSEGEIKNFSLYIGKEGWGMLLSDINADIFKFLCKGGNIDVILEEETDYGVPSKYRFTIPYYLNIPEALAQINK